VRIYTGSDHAGFSLRKTLVERLRNSGRDVVDLGTDSDAACDYPEFAAAVANAVRTDPGSLGILVCATGQGMAIAAGKVRGIRAVVPANIEAARLSRFDNNANVLCIAGRTMAESDAFAIVDTWLATGFAGGRHARRIAKVAAIETASAVSFMTESERLGLAARGVPARVFDRDAGLFSADPNQHESIRDQLGWLSLPADMTTRASEVMSFAEEARHARFKDMLLLVDNAELSPTATVARLWGAGGLRLTVLGADEQGTGRATLASLQGFDTTLIVVVDSRGKSHDIEAKEHLLWSRLQDKFLGDAEQAGRHFAAVTTAGSHFSDIAKVHRYQHVFLEPAGLDEHHRVFGFAGVLPAMLAGVEPARLLARTNPMVDACRGERLEANPGVSLGVLLGAMAKHGRNQVTMLASSSLQPLRTWIAQLLASATQHCTTVIDP
jgi:ribose 5-phosphate isomerase B